MTLQRRDVHREGEAEAEAADKGIFRRQGRFRAALRGLARFRVDVHVSWEMLTVFQIFCIPVSEK